MQLLEIKEEQAICNWEERLIRRLRQLMRGCQKVEFIISIDGTLITLRRVGKIEQIK